MQLPKTNIKLAKKSTRLQVRWFAHSVCGHFGLWPFRFVTVPVCSRFGLWPFRFVAVSVCVYSGLWPFRLVAVSICGCFGLWPFRFWPFRFVAVMTRNRAQDVPNIRVHVTMYNKAEKTVNFIVFFMVRLRSSVGPTVGIRSVRVNSTHP